MAKHTPDTPRPAALRRNRFYAALVLDDMSGRRGEMTAAAQLMYHAFLLKTSNPKLSGMFARIARDDFRHFELLGETAAALGGNPVYRLGRTQDYWHAGLVQYGRDLAGRLEGDIALKEAAIQKYSYHLRRVRDPALQALIREIISDEEEHKKLLEGAAARHCGNGGETKANQSGDMPGGPRTARARLRQPGRL